MPLDHPLGANLFDGPEGTYPEVILLRGAYDALGTVGPGGCAHEAWVALDAEEVDLSLEVVRHVAAAVGGPEPYAGGDASS